MDIRKIKKLIEMLQDSDLTEIEVKEGEESVRIVRGNAQQIEVKSIPAVKSSINISEEKDDEMSIDAGSKIKSPIVGTFYRKPSPDKPPFVEIGDVVCIVEAMKMMNEIKSEFTGKVSAINIEDGEPVEFDQSLIVID